jgi:hypothetical protein
MPSMVGISWILLLRNLPRSGRRFRIWGEPVFGYFPANQAFWRGHSQSQSGGHYRGIVESSHLPEIAHHSWRLLVFPRIGPISDRNWYTSTRRTAEGPVIPIVVLVIDGETEKLGSELIQRLGDQTGDYLGNDTAVTWVRVRCLGRSQCAENGNCGSDSVHPTFVSILR